MNIWNWLWLLVLFPCICCGDHVFNPCKVGALRKGFDVPLSGDKKITQAALEGIAQLPQDSFPVRSCVYVILYDTTGDWPRVTRSLQKFYEAVKIPCRGKAPSRQTPWRSGVVSRGFPSQVEAEAYLLGGQCHAPSRDGKTLGDQALPEESKEVERSKIDTLQISPIQPPSHHSKTPHQMQ